MPLNKGSRASCPDLIAIGSSTGGPEALRTIFKALPAEFPVPITVTQHMPKKFLESLAERINKESHLVCSVAQDDEVLKPGHIYIAPGDIHMKIKTKGSQLLINLEDGERVNHCIPSVDVTFDSLVASSLRIKTLALMLTGMGDDGAKGAKALFDKNNTVIAQDKESSTVWGMAGETVRLGAADEVLPLVEIAQRLMWHTGCKR